MHLCSNAFGSPYGSLPELITKDVGFIAKNSTELERLVKENQSEKFNPQVIRKYVEDNFSITQHALKYLELYQNVINGKKLNSQKPTYQLANRAQDLLEF